MVAHVQILRSTIRRPPPTTGWFIICDESCWIKSDAWLHLQFVIDICSISRWGVPQVTLTYCLVHHQLCFGRARVPLSETQTNL